jgi:hypothetical protein
VETPNIPVGEEPAAYGGPGPRISTNGKTHEAKPAKGAKRSTSKRQSYQRFQIANEFYSGIEASGLNPTAVAAWLILWLRTDAKSQCVKMSYATLGRKIGLQERQAKRVAQELIQSGYLEVVARGGPKEWTVNTYRVIPCPK